MLVKRTPNRINPDHTRVILLYLTLSSKDRIKHLLTRVTSLSENEVNSVLDEVIESFEGRHPYFKNPLEGFKSGDSYFKKALMKNFERVKGYLKEGSEISENRKHLIGAYFTKEYSVESAALFNPSMVPHPDQSNLDSGALRFIISLRATGEGHISSIEFQTGIVDAANNIHLDERSGYTVTPSKADAGFTKDFIKDRVVHIPGLNPKILESLSEDFTASELSGLIGKMDAGSLEASALNELSDSNYNVRFIHDGPMCERVIFPQAACESMGMEDVRFVRFDDQGISRYYGTYTAYNGHNIKSQLIETDDFTDFKVRSLYGKAINDKGMALFPRKINGKYAMISRQGGEIIRIMYSDDVHFWDHSETLQIPQEYWEFTQIGNCGSPIETEHGWLLLTHAVGPLRKYALSATLLDLENPSKILGSLKEPLLSPNQDEREGYVPNVLYTCGALLHNEEIILPYAMSDISIGFARIALDKLITKLIG